MPIDPHVWNPMAQLQAVVTVVVYVFVTVGVSYPRNDRSTQLGSITNGISTP